MNNPDWLKLPWMWEYDCENSIMIKDDDGEEMCAVYGDTNEDDNLPQEFKERAQLICDRVNSVSSKCDDEEKMQPSYSARLADEPDRNYGHIAKVKWPTLSAHKRWEGEIISLARKYVAGDIDADSLSRRLVGLMVDEPGYADE